MSLKVRLISLNLVVNVMSVGVFVIFRFNILVIVLLVLSVPAEEPIIRR